MRANSRAASRTSRATFRLLRAGFVTISCGVGHLLEAATVCAQSSGSRGTVDDHGMIAAMPVIQRVRATVVTHDLTYKAHELQIDEGNRIAAIFDQGTWEPVAILTDCEWSSQDRTRYRVEGLDGAGVRQVWASFAVCARCTTRMVVSTPEYDRPQ